ncbi:acyl-CoA/acyl-ACP dehydrogenase [Colwellia sp. MSW7]|uniref:Acyl-CoA/acyl-ACP dehydrogenase n=1 Tax=Colwellia maritima TaxID=2912588 RepID=A0ABS9X5S6_9GAMM|nr:acyl-CoA dehydrogenase family protein [Colwellia maritima]MCI2285590.1 acyl-CoA/acyl-ACP dehydrogenase [Colwellia maritima]
MPTIDDFIRPKEWVSEEAEAMRFAIRKWADERLKPITEQIDEDWKEHKLVDPLLKELLVDMGLNSAFFPEEFGGQDMPEDQYMAMSAVVCEELSRVDSGFATAAMCSTWGLVPILMKPHRNLELLEELAPKFCGEEFNITCHAITEPASGADVENLGILKGKTIKTTATEDGDDWIIKGHKIWCTNSGKTGTYFIVIASTCTGSEDLNEFGLFLVPADSEGVSVGEPYHKCGMSADMNTDIWFDNVRIPKRYRLHGAGDDVKYFKRTVSMGQIGAAAMAVGVMKSVYETIKTWTTERIVAGKPLKEHSICADMLSEIAINIESTSAWMWQYIREWDHPEIYGMQPWDDDFVHKSRGLAIHAGIAVEKTCSRAMDFMSSYGYSREFGIEKHWRDSKMVGLWMGGYGLKTVENARYWFESETI